MKVFHYHQPFRLESGVELPGIDIAYHTFGELNRKRDNCVWVAHALTANSDVSDWWPHTVETGRFLDPARAFVVCANILGSCYGSTGPLSTNPHTGQPWYTTFPRLTMRDVAHAHALLANHLGLHRMYALVGSSVGGFQAMEWAVEEPDRFERLILIATDAKASPWAIAIDETQRMAIMADSTYGEHRPDAASAGLAAARAIGLLTYRGPLGYNISQQDPESDGLPEVHRACTYQQHQGRKLIRRFDAYSYMTILDTFDTHDVGRARGGVAKALSRLTMPTVVIGLTTDIIFTPNEMKRLASMIPSAIYREINSPLGHDGFLVEHEQLNSILYKFLWQQ